MESNMQVDGKEPQQVSAAYAALFMGHVDGQTLESHDDVAIQLKDDGEVSDKKLATNLMMPQPLIPKLVTPRGRKREREPETKKKEEELSPKSKRKIQNRLYCKENRRKKKEYVIDLENTVEKLEKEVVRLNNIIDKYRFKIGVHVIGEEKDFEEFNDFQEQQREKTINSLKEGVSKDELKKKIKEFSKFTGLASNDRKRLIKAATRVIIENLVPHRLRFIFNISENATETSFDDIKKLYSCDLKRFMIDSKDPKYDDYDRLHYFTKLDPKIHAQCKVRCERFRIFKAKFKTLVHDLIKLRNRIFNVQADFSQSDHPTKVGLTPENVIRFIEIAKKKEHDKEHDIFSTWGITRTGETSTMGEDYTIAEDRIELSDIEESVTSSRICDDE